MHKLKKVTMLSQQDVQVEPCGVQDPNVLCACDYAWFISTQKKHIQATHPRIKSPLAVAATQQSQWHTPDKIWFATYTYTCIASQLSQWPYAMIMLSHTSIYMLGFAATAVTIHLVHTHTNTHTCIVLQLSPWPYHANTRKRAHIWIVSLQRKWAYAPLLHTHRYMHISLRKTENQHTPYSLMHTHTTCTYRPYYLVQAHANGHTYMA